MFYHEIWPLPVLLGWLQTLHRLLFMLDTEDQHHRLRDERSFGYKNSHTISLLPIHHKSIPSFSSRPLAVSPAMQYPPAWPLSYPLSNHLLHIIHLQPLRRSLWLVLDNRIKVIASPSSLSSEEIFRLIGIEKENSSEFVFAHLWLWCFGAWIGKSAQKWKRNCFITKINRIVLWPTERETVLVGPCPRIVGVMIIHIGRAGGAASSQTVWGSALERYDSVVSAAKRVKRAYMKRVFA